MHIANMVLIQGDAEQNYPRLFQRAADLAEWPILLPHYRYLHVREETERHKIADFGASRDGFPVKWQARQELFPEEGRITFRHTGGITKGMWVEWQIEKRGDHLRVTIHHELTYPVPFLGELFAHHIVGNLFVSNIAGKTLRCFKEQIETEESSRAALKSQSIKTSPSG